ncbi:MAG TPA: D-alanine--D-alanine ligase [Dokdonella sp.]|jgi:D-alanine-D-alanine ligase|uniref:D-alanine--D-alanine ligase n=1 Tax=Dokdonella sp. TaxID=2291710 RepID=UPI001B50CA80|nr:D-alanine--D-alanine ligase [Dokdonella sp.]MBP6325710.1 D-alanine--D-alanine ligase [Dokdonella sp.]HNV07286.1 D-alanine--D-alanine ligase [Dokdonella sp.]HPW02569.1 D-alanine--D-alanine ligase [Dokdonella sp.]
MSTTTDPRRFGRVAVAYGGNSAEREVSLDSGRNVLAALRARGVDAHPVDGIPALLDALRAGHYARVFNILHGRGGEDGMLQGALDALRIPYTGSGILGSALAMDKVRSKRVWQALSLPTPAYAAYRPGEDLAAAIASVGYPAIVKPSHEGSSVGISRVFSAGDLPQAIDLASRYDGELLIERLIEGDELTIGILGNHALPSIRIVPAGAFYDYHAKYVAEDTRYLCPGLEGEAETEIRALAFAAFEAAGCSGWGRVDVMRDAQGNNFLLEVNTTPGMTSHSLVPKAAKATGMDFESLCWRILETSLARDAG